MTAAYDDRPTEIAALLARLAELIATPAVPAPRREIPVRELLTAEEAAERLNIGRTRVFALIKSGELDSVRIGRSRRISIAAISEYTARLSADSERGPQGEEGTQDASPKAS